MPRYIYTTVDTNGALQKSEGEYSSVNDLFISLQRKGLDLIKYRRALFSVQPRMGRKLHRLVLAEFFRNLALLLRGGVPLRDALTDLVAAPGQPLLSAVFGRVTARIEDGMLFSEALEKEQKYIPKIIIPLVSIGEETGNLDQTLGDAADHLEKVHQIISSTRRALTYPSFVLVAMLGALIFWMVFVLPQLLELFATMGLKELPLATRILVNSVAIFDDWWPLIPASLFLFLLTFFISRKNKKLHYLWDLCWSYSPLIGTIIRSSQLAFFFEYTALLTSGGIHIVRSMELMEESVSHQVLKKGIEKIRAEIIAGEAMSVAVSGFRFFEPFILRMVKVGEQTGSMAEQFHILATFYMKKVNDLVEVMSKTLEPVIITIAGFVFMVIAMGLLGPVYLLVSSIQ